jgi:hypothetical protein
MTSFLLQVSEDCVRSWTEGEIKPGRVKGCDDSDLVWKEKKKEEAATRKKKDKFLSKVMLSEYKQWQGDVCWLMTFQHGDKCLRKREVYGWAEVFKFAWSIVGDAHSGLPWTVMYVEVKVAIFSVYSSEQENTIRDVTPV